MTEQIPTPEEYRLLEKTLIEKILDQAATDPQWKQLLLEDPEAAMQEAAFPEPQRLTEINERVRAMQEDAEVVGHLGSAAPLCLPVSGVGIEQPVYTGSNTAYAAYGSCTIPQAPR